MTKSPSVVKSPYMTKKQRRESDLKSLQKERKDNKFPLTKPPFRKDGAPKEPKVSVIYFALYQSDRDPSRRRRART